MPKAVKATKVSAFHVGAIIENEKNVSESFTACFYKSGLEICEYGAENQVKISREFLPEFLAALQTTYPDAFALIDKHQKPQK